MSDRQTIVTLSVQGPYTSKPRPWVIIQNDDFAGTDSIVMCPLTHLLIEGAPLLRIDVTPSAENGLRVASQIQAEKIVTVRRGDLDQRIGRLEDDYMRLLETAVRDILGSRGKAAVDVAHIRVGNAAGFQHGAIAPT